MICRLRWITWLSRLWTGRLGGHPVTKATLQPLEGLIPATALAAMTPLAFIRRRCRKPYDAHGRRTANGTRRKYTERQLWTGTTDVLVSERISLPDPIQTLIDPAVLLSSMLLRRLLTGLPDPNRSRRIAQRVLSTAVAGQSALTGTGIPGRCLVRKGNAVSSGSCYRMPTSSAVSATRP